MASACRSSRAPSNGCSAVSDSDSDMWSVASDDEEAFGPRLDAASLWQLLRKAHPSFRNQEEPKHLVASAVERLQAGGTGAASSDEAEQRREPLGEPGQELLSWYAQRVGELERENKALRCNLIKDELGQAPPPPLPHFKSGRFDIAGSDNESDGGEEDEEDSEDSPVTEKQRHSLANLFDIDWQRVGAENPVAIAKSLSRRSSHAATRLPSRDGEDSFEETDLTEADAEPEGELLNAARPADHFLALEKLLVSLSEADARLIWLQFARYESEIGYLRSVISSYEDICLQGMRNNELGGDTGARIRGLSRRRGFDVSRPRRHSHVEAAVVEQPAAEAVQSEALQVAEKASASLEDAKKPPAERVRRRSTAATMRSASTASGAGGRLHLRGSAHAILHSARLSLLEQSAAVGNGFARRGRRLSRPGLYKPDGSGGDDPKQNRAARHLQNIEAFLAEPPAQGKLPPTSRPEDPGKPAAPAAASEPEQPEPSSAAGAAAAGAAAAGAVAASLG